MNAKPNALYELLPAIYRLRDEEQNGPLRGLWDVIASQVEVLEEDLNQLYDDQFIETCADWVVPYIGDLIGYLSLHHPIPSLGNPRSEVANTIGYRRRKGTAAMLEQLARDVTNWPAKVVEFFQLVATTQFMNHVRLANGLSPDLRRWDRLESLDGPFDTLAHSVDTRHIALGEGRINIPNIGVFLWRIAANPLRRSPGVGLDANRFFFSPLGNDTPLFTRPQTEPDVTHLATHMNVPDRITRRRMSEFLGDYYGDGESVFIDGVPKVQICDLSDVPGGWAHSPPAVGTVSIDPVLGRIAFGDAQAAPPLVSFHYGFSLDIGGGEYERTESFALPMEPVQSVLTGNLIQTAINTRVAGRAIQIDDNGRYAEKLALNANPGEKIEIRAANQRRPTLILPADFIISGGDNTTEVTLSGLLIAGAGIRITGSFREVRLRDCTLVPGITLDSHGVPQQLLTPSLTVENGDVTVTLERCILGSVRWDEFSRLEIRSSIVDSTNSSGVALSGTAPAVAGQPESPGGLLRLEECTVVGKIRVSVMELVSNSILEASTAPVDLWPAPVIAERRQTGCVRFSYVPKDSRTPQRFRCQPDYEISQTIEAAEKAAHSKNKVLTDPEKAALRREVYGSMKPAFTSLNYGHPAYAQLRARSPSQIKDGADDESEMGAYHDLFEPQRLTNARIRLEEYLRFGLETGIFTVT